MSAFDKLLAAADRLSKKSTPLKDFWSAAEPYVPNEFSCRELVDNLVKPEAPDRRKYVAALAACLHHDSRVRSDSDDDAAIDAISDFVAKSIAPVAEPHDSEDEGTPDTDATVSKSRLLAPYGLSALQAISRAGDARLSEESLLTVVAFTNAKDLWMATAETAALADDIIEAQFCRPDYDFVVFIVDTILKGYLRPLFSKSKPASVTSSGRKAEFPDDEDAQRGLEGETARNKPWKYTDLRAIPVFQWAVTVAFKETVREQWPLFIPVLVTLLEETTTQIRARGLAILDEFLGKFPPSILQNTGLGSVFEQAVLPTLLYLPSLTPENESIQLLEPAYKALLTLAGKLKKEDKFKLLDKVLRDGIFAGYFHSNEHVRIVEVLVREAGKVVTTMGLPAVKHLKDLMPMYSTIMTDPFALSYPPLLLAAIESLQSTISVCWPRIVQSPTQDEIIKILVLCWLNIHEDATSKAPDDIEAALVKTASILTAVLKAGKIDMAEKIAPLIAKEPCLRDLYKDALAK